MPEIFSRREIEAMPEVVYDACRSVSLHEHLARKIGGKAIRGKTKGLSEHGDQTTWEACFFGIKFRIETMITLAESPWALDDTMTRGLFREFGHQYRLSQKGQKTVLEDRFKFACPGGTLGEIFAKFMILPKMKIAQEERMHGLQLFSENKNTELSVFIEK